MEVTISKSNNGWIVRTFGQDSGEKSWEEMTWIYELLDGAIEKTLELLTEAG